MTTTNHTQVAPTRNPSKIESLNALVTNGNISPVDTITSLKAHGQTFVAGGAA